VTDPEARPGAGTNAPGGWQPPGSPPPATGPAHATILQAGQSQLAAYVRDGYAVYLVAGIAGVGKTELLVSYQRQRSLVHDTVYLPPRAGRSAGGGPTPVGSVMCYPIAAGGRKVLLVDASGEHFRSLYPHLRPAGALQAAEVDFLKLVGKNLHGLALLIDLEKLWQPQRDADGEQLEIANWILILLRWLRYAGAYDAASSISFQDEVNRTAMILKRRLELPVLVLFSRADQLNGLKLPAEPVLGVQSTAMARGLFPVGEQPLLLAYHALPLLYRSLRTHCTHFHVDFAHSLQLDPTGKMIAERSPVGVTTALDWLLDRSWRWPGTIPTRHWIWMHRQLDRFRGPSAVWRRLPPPARTI
jgi:hypothetical protein